MNSKTEDWMFALHVRLLRIMNMLISRYIEPLMMECEIFLTHLVKFLDSDRPMWQRVLSCEVLHYICSQPNLLRVICRSYDLKQSSTKVRPYMFVRPEQIMDFKAP